MRLLITRAEPDASELKVTLEALGHDVMVEPLLRIELLPVASDALAGAQAVLLTSRNAVRAVATCPALAAALTLPVFAVSPGTAGLARASGFARVTTGAGAARELAALVAANADHSKGPLVHIAGEQLAFDLAAALTARGFAVHKVTAYRAVPARALSQTTAQRIAGGSLDAILLMSPRTSAIFAQLVKNAGLKDAARRLTYVCLSERVAEALGDLAPSRLEIAAAPDSAAMLAAVTRVATQSTGV